MYLAVLLLALSCAAAWPQHQHQPVFDSEDAKSAGDKEPIFLSEPQRITAKKGQVVTLPCQLDSLGSYALLWWSKQVLLYANGIKMSKDPRISFTNHDLRIEGVTDKDVGNYSCQLSTADQKTLNHELLVEVEPKVKARNREVVERQGQSAVLSCIVLQGFPVPEVSWKKDGQPLDWRGEEVTIDSVDRRNSGKYTCVGSNGVGEPSWDTIQLTVSFKPEIQVEEEWIHSGEGLQAEISCTVLGEPKPVVEWFRSGQQIEVSQDPKYKVTNEGSAYTLQIDQLDETDFGLYVCSARNDEGEATKEVEVSGLAKDVQITSLPNGDFPDSYRLTWSVESYSAVHEYKVLYRRVQFNDTVDIPGDWVEMDAPGHDGTGIKHDASLTIPSLSPATQYEVTVQVRNKFGWNTESSPFRFATLGAHVPEPTTPTSGGGALSAVIPLVLTAALAQFL